MDQLIGQHQNPIREQFEHYSIDQRASYPDTISGSYQLINYGDVDSIYEFKFSDAHVNILVINNSVDVDTLYAGIYVGRSKFKPGQKHFYFPLRLRAHDTTLLELKAYNILKMDIISEPLLLKEGEALSWLDGLYATSRSGMFFMIFFLGAILSLFLYFFMLSVFTPRTDFVFYSIYLFAVLCHYILVTDHSFGLNIVFPEQPQKIMMLNDFTSNLMYAVYMAFLIKFLEAKKHSIFLYRYLQFELCFHLLIGVVLSATVHLTMDIELVREKLSFLYIVAFTLSLVTIVLMYIKIPSKLKYFVITGSVILGLSSLKELSYYSRGFLIQDYQIPGSSWFSFNFTQAGIIAEVLCFALGIGFKINEVYTEKDKAQANLIDQLEENVILKDTMASKLQGEVEKQSNLVVQEKEKNIKKIYENQILELESELLRSQMNPHFIFNSLNSIKYYALTKDGTQTAIYITKFSKLMRMILQHSRKHLLSLSDEIEFLNLYLEVESKRFADKLNYNIEVDKLIDKERVLLPPMLLQPLIENAIVHGILPLKEQGMIKILFMKTNEGFLKVSIEDNGIGREASHEVKKKNKHLLTKDSLATDITTNRISLINELFQTRASIQIVDLYNQEDYAIGTKVLLHIPLNLNEKTKIAI